VPDSLASQVFTLHVDAEPTALDLDPGDWILKQVDRPVVQPPFDRGVLVVNGVDWATYGAEILGAYTDRAFQGDYTIDFWDHFNAPAGGYPAVLPAPLGHGPVPRDVLGHYRNVVWVGNDFNGDVDSWVQTALRSYLDAGGNVFLLAKDGQDFLDPDLLAYLGVTLTGTGATIVDCVATRPGLVNLARTGAQSACVVFDTVRTQPDSQLLWKTTSGFSPQRGIGVVRLRAGGAGLRAAGGRFAFLSGRPYRWNHANLKATTNTVLSQFFLEPLNGLGVPGSPGTLAHVRVSAARPDPATGPAGVRLDMPATARVRLDVIDVAGRVVREIDAGRLASGAHDLVWDGRDREGRATPAGIYWLRVRVGAEEALRRVVRLD
jgi:hypothetical protein